MRVLLHSLLGQSHRCSGASGGLCFTSDKLYMSELLPQSAYQFMTTMTNHSNNQWFI